MNDESEADAEGLGQEQERQFLELRRAVEEVDKRVKTPQFDPEQRRRAIELIESMAWGDMDLHIRSMEEALQLALEATVDGFQRWERDGEEHFGADEFQLSPQQIEDLDDEWRLAYVARLIRSLGLVYGIATDFGGRETTLDDDGDGPAGLLRGLNDIAHMPLVPEPCEG